MIAYCKILIGTAMESYINPVIKNISAWTRKATVLAVDSLSTVGTSALDSANVLLVKARVIVLDNAVILGDTLRSLTGKGRS